MKTLTIKRVASNQHGTFGVMIDNGVPFAVTLERPWKDNMRFESCIPAGAYTCQRKISPQFGETFEIVSVPGRDDVLFHKGNTMQDTEGCILIGEEFGRFRGQASIMQSGRGFGEFMDKLQDKEDFTIIILNFT